MRSTLLWLRKLLHAIGDVIVFTSSLISPTEAFGQTNSYVVTGLTGEDAAQVPSKLNNLGDIGEILAMGQLDHGGMAPEDHLCAPAPPLSFLLTPIASP